ncbi:hypothetical protein ACFWUQ_16960 [Streptomyces sp. NPDC058662]|uniref:hypothetical protein n=1 Tax=Streptomyces sp. NPDC058662 TaxID=3346583 RepID=UPI00365D4DC6
MTNRADIEDQWAALPAGIRDQVDGYVLQDGYLQAVLLARTAGRARGVDLIAAQRIVRLRYEHFGDRVARTPDSPLDLASLAALAHGVAGRVVAVEAVWDGDTVHDWFVNLLAVSDGPAGETCLAAVYRDPAVRALAGADAGPLHPSAAVATRAGTALAAHLGVPFHFASPDRPDDEAPRRRL